MKRQPFRDWLVEVPGSEPFAVRATSEARARVDARRELVNRHWIKTGELARVARLPRGTKLGLAR